MVRKKTDPFWQYVDELPQNRWKCKFCGNEYPGHVSRIKAHLGQVKNRGIDICDKVNERVKEEALTALCKVAPDKQQSIDEGTAQWIDQGIGSENDPFVDPQLNYSLLQDYQAGYNYNQYSSGEAQHLVVPEASAIPSDNNELNPAILHAQSQQADPLPNSSFQQVNEVNTMIGTSQQLQRQSMNQPGVREHSVRTCTEFDTSLSTLKRKLKCLSDRKGEKEEEFYQWSKKLKNQKLEKEEALHQWSKKVKAMKRFYQRIEEGRQERSHPSLEQLDQVKELINQAEELNSLDIPEKETSRVAPSSKAPPFLISKLIGRDDEKSKIWDNLKRDGILRTSVYGMGGVGKTEIMMNIYNELLDDEEFDNVFWVTMPKDFSVFELQSIFGNVMHLEELFNEKDEKIRAAILNRFLTSGKKYVIILDGLWRHFEYRDVGIPSKYNGLKLVITCQSLYVSRMMLCQEKIKIRPFSDLNSCDWELFIHELDVDTELPKEVVEIAQSMVKACQGLPLYIKAVATRMRGVENVQNCRDVREKMNDSREKYHVLDHIKLSYDSLDNHHLQRCLIFCAFYLRIREAARPREVEEFLVDMGLIDETDSREELLHKARNNLKELEKACLLNAENGPWPILDMHDSIIDMALRVATNTNLFMVDFDISLSHEEFQDLKRLSLLKDAENEVSRPSTNGFMLPILISQSNAILPTGLPYSLFTVFSDISILNLSSSDIEELPESFSYLVRLTALVLRECTQLRYIPNVRKLTSLRKLDLCSCESLGKLPDGLEYLVNLEYLDCSGTFVYELPERVLRTFEKLQYLSTGFVSFEAEEIEGLDKLETLCCRFSNFKELTTINESPIGKRHAGTKYTIAVGDDDQWLEFAQSWYDFEVGEDYKTSIILGEIEDMESEVVGPKNVERIEIYNCKGLECLIGSRACTNFPFLPYLRKITISKCPDFRRMIGAQLVLPSLVHGAFSRLETINISFCNEFEEIIASSSSEMPCPTPTVTPAPPHFSHLTSLTISHCGKMRRLLNHGILLHLSSLRSIKVMHRSDMEELTSTYNERILLPNLKILYLDCLPKLTSIGTIAIGCPIEIIRVTKCPMIRSIPFQMHQLPNGVPVPPSSFKVIVISGDDKEWWESLEWESLEAKAALQPFVHDVDGLLVRSYP